jgi:hypothetical protein
MRKYHICNVSASILVVIHLTTVSVAQSIQCRIAERLVNNDLERNVCMCQEARRRRWLFAPNWKGWRKKRSWPDLGHYPPICLERVGKTRPTFKLKSSRQ